MFRSLFLMIAMVVSLSVAEAADSVTQLSPKDMKTAMEMNKIYARHMYSSACVERQRSMYVSPMLNQATKAGLMAEFQKSCDCLTDSLLKEVNSNDVIGYVTYMNGSVEPGTKKVKPDAQAKEKNAKIMAFGHNKDNRRACGFKQ